MFYYATFFVFLAFFWHFWNVSCDDGLVYANKEWICSLVLRSNRCYIK